MKKENMYIRFIRFFYDIVGEIDQDHYAALMNFGNNMYMLFTTIMVVTFFISWLLGEDIIGISLFIVFFYAQIKKERLISSLGLDMLVVSKEEQGLARKKMMKRTLFQSLYLFLVTLMVTIGLWHSNIPQENGTSSVVYWQFAAPVTIIGVTFVGFIVLYIVNRLKIKLVS